MVVSQLPVIPVVLAVGGGLAAAGFLPPLAATPPESVGVGRRPDAPRGAALLARRPTTSSPGSTWPPAADRVPRRRGARAGRPRRGRALAATAGRHAADALDLRAPARSSASSCPSAPGWRHSPCSKSRSGSFRRGTSSASRRRPRSSWPLALAVLAGVGVDALTRRRGRRPSGRCRARARLLVAADYHPWRPAGISGLPGGGPEFATIRAEGPRALWIPFWPGDSAYSGLYLYATTLTRVPMLNGYSAWLDRSFLTERLPPPRDREPRRGRRGRGPGAAPVRRASGDPRPGRLPAEGERLRPGADARLPPGLALSRSRRDAGRRLDAPRVPRPGHAPRGAPGAAPHEPARHLLGGRVARARYRPRRRRSRRVERAGEPCPERRGPAWVRHVRPVPAACRRATIARGSG